MLMESQVVRDLAGLSCQLLNGPRSKHGGKSCEDISICYVDLKTC